MVKFTLDLTLKGVCRPFFFTGKAALLVLGSWLEASLLLGVMEAHVPNADEI